MEIKYFVYGKFRDNTPDFGVRVISPILSEAEAKTYAPIIIGLNQLCRIQNNTPPYIEYIRQDRYNSTVFFYTRFFPAKGNQDDSGNEMIGFSQTMVLSLQDLITLEYKPWVCKERFIRLFDNEKIVGWDGSTWFDRIELAIYKETPKKIPLSLEISTFYNGTLPDITNYEARSDNSVQYIQAINAYSTLEDLGGDTLLRIFNLGLILNYPVEYGSPRDINDLAKFVIGRSSLTDDFKKANWKNLTPQSIKSYVGGLFEKVNKTEPQPTLYPQVMRDSSQMGKGEISENKPGISIDKSEIRDTPTAQSPSPADEKSKLNDLLTEEKNKTHTLAKQRTILIIAVTVCLVGMGILAWIVFNKPGVPIKSGETVTKIDSIKLIDTTHPEPPKPIAGDKVTKQQYDDVVAKYFEVDIRLKKTNEAYIDLGGKYNALVSQNEMLNRSKIESENNVRNLNGQLSNIKSQKDSLLDQVVPNLQSKIAGFQAKIASMPKQIADSLRPIITNELRGKEKEQVQEINDTTAKKGADSTGANSKTKKKQKAGTKN